MESTSYVLSFRMVFFDLETTGWILDISLCENSINQSNDKKSIYNHGNQCVDRPFAVVAINSTSIYIARILYHTMLLHRFHPRAETSVQSRRFRSAPLCNFLFQRQQIAFFLCFLKFLPERWIYSFCEHDHRPGLVISG